MLVAFDSSQLQYLASLSVLDVRDNKITVIPDDITTLTELERLDITNNNVSA